MRPKPVPTSRQKREYAVALGFIAVCVFFVVGTQFFVPHNQPSRQPLVARTTQVTAPRIDLNCFADPRPPGTYCP